MDKEQQPSDVTTGRALLTEREREELARSANTSYKYKTRSLVRQRITKLKVDIQVLKEHHPDLYDELKTTVCQENE